MIPPALPKIWTGQEAALVIALGELLQADVLGAARTATATRLCVGLHTIGQHPPSVSVLGAVLDRMGVAAGRHGHRDVPTLRDVLPAWSAAAQQFRDVRRVVRLPGADMSR